MLMRFVSIGLHSRGLDYFLRWSAMLHLFSRFDRSGVQDQSVKKYDTKRKSKALLFMRSPITLT